jgi:hypothetical protein
MSSEQILGSHAWCVFRNLVHAVYREARHLGPKGDQDACVMVSEGPLLASAERCRKFRALLKSAELHKRTAKARSTGETLKPYQDVTGLGVADMIAVFRLPGWRRQYGGSKWARIAETLCDLISALDAGDLVAASQISDSVSSLNHNSGPLVPTRLAWEAQPYLREKWPELCD